MVYEFFEELKSIIKEAIKSFFQKFKYGILGILIVLLVIGIFTLKRETPEQIESQQIYFLGITIENWAQWITIITIPCTAWWAIFQYKKSVATRKQEKATEIANKFSDTLINDLYMIETVYKKSLLAGFFPLREEQIDQFKYFNVQEIRKIYKNDDFVYEFKKTKNLLKEQLDNLYHLELYKNIVPYSKFEDCYKLEEKIIKNEVEESELEKLETVFKNNSQVPYHFLDLQVKVLNKLEYVCMDISSKAADSNYIYQSLHQMFLRSMRFLGLHISVINENSTDKYYTNIIHVYNDWRNKYKKNLKLENRRLKKSDESLNPKIKTV